MCGAERQAVDLDGLHWFRQRLLRATKQAESYLRLNTSAKHCKADDWGRSYIVRTNDRQRTAARQV